MNTFPRLTARMTEREKELRVIRDMLLLVDCEVPLTVLRRCRVDKLGRAAAWAGRTYLRASDNVYGPGFWDWHRAVIR